LQVGARVLREASWQVIPARELVPGDIVRMRSGDIIPADVKLLTGEIILKSVRMNLYHNYFS
jgi:H+-transporting ATPase